MDSHLGYSHSDREGKAANGRKNSRNGSYAKTVDSQVGPIEIQVPRDREGEFTPRLVPKGSRRLGGLDDMIISLYAGGMTVREIQWHLGLLRFWLSPRLLRSGERSWKDNGHADQVQRGVQA